MHTLSADAADTLGRLIRDLPHEIHLLLVGRSAPQFSLSRLRSAGLLELGQQDLAFTEADSQALLDGAHLADTASAVSLHALTEGWPAGLLLAARAGSDVAATDEPHTHLFDYLAEEVFGRQDERTREFLLATAVLDRFTPQLAAEVTDQPDAERTVQRLVAEHLFTVPLESDGQWYRYHHLFQAFLRRRLAEDPDRVAAAHRAAAAASLGEGDRLEAVRHALLGGDHATAVDALEPVAEALVASPHADAVGRWLDEIPRDLWSDRPGLVLAHASLMFNRANYDAAFGALETAVDELIASGEHERASMALHRLLLAYTTAGGHQQRGIATGRRFLALLPDGPTIPAVRLRLASLLGYAGRVDDADRELRAIEQHDPAPAVAAYTQLLRAFYVDYPLGRITDALTGLQRAARVLEEGDDPLAHLPYARAYAAIIRGHLGHYEESLADVPRLVEAAERVGLGRVAAPVVAWLRFGAYIGLGRWTALQSALDETRPIFARLGVAVRSHLFAAAEAAAAAQRGEVTATLTAIDAARTGLRAYGYPFEDATVLPDLAHAAAAAGHADLAEELLVEARDTAVAARAPWPAARSVLLLAHLVGPGERGDALLAEAIATTREHALDDLWKRRERHLAAELLSSAIKRAIGPDGAAAELAAACGGEVLERCAALLEDADAASRARLADAAALRSGTAAVVGRLARDADPMVRKAARRSQKRIASRARPALHIALLGGFGLRRDGEPVPDGAYGRQKAKLVLAVLACHPGPVHREAILDWVWPNLPPDRGLASLHSTLHTLRRVLEPDLARGAGSSRVVADGEAFRLVLGDDGDLLDVAHFLALADQASSPDASIEELVSAEAAYAGPVVPEWPYAEWAQMRRVEVAEAYAAVCERLAEELVLVGRPTAAIARYRRLLALEPEREGWHRALMRVYARSGERALALRQFHACRALLRRELGVEPGPETRDLYNAVLREESVS